MDNVGTSQKIDRLVALRGEIAREKLDGFLVPRGDEHLGEYVPECAERLAWISGFTGSAGMAVVLMDRALIWSDGRYVLQLATQTDGDVWERLHLGENPPGKYLGKHFAGARIGYDPWLISEDSVKRFAEDGVQLVPVAANLVDLAWKDRPAAPLGEALPHDIAYSGESSEEKRGRVAQILRDEKLDAAVISDPASLAWLLNLRGQDVDCTPFALGFVVARADASVDLFMAPEKLPAVTRAFLGNQVAVYPRGDLARVLGGFTGERVRVDRAGSAVWFANVLREAGAEVVAGGDPCAELKACKNVVEQAGARLAHQIDGVALIRFLHWFSLAGVGESEVSVARKLQEFRGKSADFKGDSFPAISGAGEDGAIIHYHATGESDRVVCANEVFLIDSGGQYFAGTTDVTRTLWTGPEAAPAGVREHFTRVLQGHIAISLLRFPDGCEGVRLDSFARKALWDVGLDYDHGTGHGVGSFLSVHEGPISISPYLRPAGIHAGMIVSNEPGFYAPGEYGIRIENLLLVEAAETSGKKKFLQFEVLTLAPIERRLIEVGLLSAEEITWLDAYHARVLTEIGPRLDDADRAWLASVCAPLK